MCSVGLAGATSGEDTDTYHGRFVKLVPDEEGGTEILAVHDRLPPGLSPADNEAGWRSSPAKLSQLVDSSAGRQRGAARALMTAYGDDYGE